MNYLLVFLGVVLNVGAQVCLKAAVGTRGLTMQDLMRDWYRILFSPLVIVGLVLYAASVVNWLVVLSRLPLSVAYPLMSLGYVFAFLIGVWAFREPWNWVNLIGVFLVLGGVALLARQVQSHP